MLILEVFRVPLFYYPPPPLREKRANRLRLAFPREAIQFYEYCRRASPPPLLQFPTTTRIQLVDRTLQHAFNARICKRSRHFSPTPLLFGKRTALFPRINQFEFEGSSKANDVVNTLCRVLSSFFFSLFIEISKYREISRFQDILLRNFFSSLRRKSNDWRV